MDTELISVIINVYNAEKYIKKCLNNILHQTYKNIEILIINDGSTDNTLDIINNYIDNRIKVITTKHLGLSLSRNVGINNANGKYLYFIDVDDYIDENTIRYLYNLIKRNNALIATCKCVDVDNYSYKVKKASNDYKIYTQKEFLKKVLLSRNREVAIWNKLIHKSLFDNLRFENRVINDISFTYKVILKAKKVVYGNDIKYYHFINKDSISIKAMNDYKRNIDRYKASIERYKHIKKIIPDLKENDVALMQTIARLYRIHEKNLRDYLKKEDALKKYRRLYNNKLLKLNISKLTRVKLKLFYISPLLHNCMVNLYLNIKKIV